GVQCRAQRGCCARPAASPCPPRPSPRRPLPRPRRRPRRRRSRGSWIRTRRWRPCPISASNGPTSTRGTRRFRRNRQRRLRNRAATTEATGTIRYTLDVEGLASVAGAEDLLKAFRQQSTLEAERKHPANAAQIGRRANADADLLAQLLRSQGYYDASVDPRTERSGDGLRVILAADPGVQYRFASVELPGLDAAGTDAAALRAAFAIKPGDPVIAQKVIAAGVALTTALGEEALPRQNSATRTSR